MIARKTPQVNYMVYQEIESIIWLKFYQQIAVCILGSFSGRILVKLFKR
jgi:hypothetical protein